MVSEFDPSQYHVVVIAGGRSSERNISLASGGNCCEALEAAGFTVTMKDHGDKENLKDLIDGGYDVAFLCTHGKYGEDGSLQGFLELIDLPYTGSGIWASSTAMNKAKAKDVYHMAGIKTPMAVHLRRGDEIDVASIVAVTGEHCVVKAASEGSTLGLYICTGADEVGPSINQAFEHDDYVVVESFVEGDEFTVGVIGGQDCTALPVIQIVPASGFYDFEAKYAPGGSKHLCPAPVSEELSKKMQGIAVNAHKALDCHGVSRTDIIVDEQGECWALETNTLPGMTNTSLVPDAAAVMGISFQQLCTDLVRSALERAGRL